jgi:hypothetical protein
MEAMAAMGVEGQAWLNTAKYTTPELVLFIVGCFGWVVAYVAVLAKISKYRYVEIPAGAVVANIAWEFVWGFLYVTDMGRLFVWGYRAWFFLDVFIVYCLFRYGDKQVVSPALRRYFRPAAVLGILFWAVAIYYMVGEGYDTPYGAISGYVLNVMMSALYVVLIVNAGRVEYFSYLVAWSKMLGTALLSVFNYMVKGDDLFLMTLCLVTLLLDLLYIFVFHAMARRTAAAAA